MSLIMKEKKKKSASGEKDNRESNKEESDKEVGKGEENLRAVIEKTYVMQSKRQKRVISSFLLKSGKTKMCLILLVAGMPGPLEQEQ